MPHRPSVHKWYCSASWLRCRRHQLRLEPLCEICLEADRVTPATVADSNHTEATTTPSGSARSAASARPAMMASTVAIARPFARVRRSAPIARRAIRDIRGTAHSHLKDYGRLGIDFAGVVCLGTCRLKPPREPRNPAAGRSGKK